ncbi:MAG: ribosome-associated translation inhibitor RaiA [Deltaproteobacteria bacterium]|nr:ribosome-associated translation inhibitor RaiA [Deltaproteobacteria bacterium]
MQVSVTFKHLEPTDAIRSYAEDKVGKIKKYLDNPVDANVVLSVEKFRHIAEVNLIVNGIAVAATDATEDMYSSIDNVMDKIERQLRRHKERIKRHKPRNNQASAALEETVYSSESMEVEEAPAVIKMENYFAKPMSVDEAIMQLDLLHRDFFVYTNASTNNISVVYRRKDGNYGLIEPKNT